MENIWGPLLVFFAMGGYGLVHSWLASLGFKARVREWWGVAAERWYRLLYNLFAGISFLPVLALVWWLPDRLLYTIPFPWSLLAMAGQGLALVVLLLALRQTDVWSFLGLRQLLDANREAGEGNGPSQKLVVRGFYRWVRHPLYTAGLVLIWLLPTMSMNVLALNLGLTLYLVIGAWFEERKLVHEFGEAYVRYQRRIPMLIPLPRRVAKVNPDVQPEIESRTGGKTEG